MPGISNIPVPAVVQSGDGKVFQVPNTQEALQFEASVQQAGGETLRLGPEVLPAARTLYDIEAHLAALVDTEALVPEELEQEYALELQATLLATVEKRDHVGQFLAHLEAQIAFAHAEVARLKVREEFYEKVFARMESYVARVIESLGLDAKGKRKKLEGNTITLALHGCDKRVEVTDEGSRAHEVQAGHDHAAGRDVGAGVRRPGPGSPRASARGGEVAQD
jgi:Siphovirus Gp157